MGGRHIGKPCYYCGAPSTSTEHAPARMVLRGFECDSITVPSCDAHNSKKSGDDQAVVNGHLMPLYNANGRYSSDEEVIKAIEIASGAFHYTKRKTFDVPIIAEPAFAQLFPNVAYVDASVAVERWIRQLSAALVYDCVGDRDEAINWEQAVVWGPDFYKSKKQAPWPVDELVREARRRKGVKADLETGKWVMGWSATPRPYPTKIYHFHVLIRNHICFRHRLYNQYSWYVMAKGAAPETKARVRERIGQAMPVMA